MWRLSARSWQPMKAAVASSYLPELDVFRSFSQLRLAPWHFDARMERNFSVPLQIPGETKVPERLLSIEMEHGRSLRRI